MAALRWRALLLSALLVVGLLGRGHALQLVGVNLGCAHPLAGTGEAVGCAAEGEERDDEHADPDHQHCPPNCHQCPCGQLPVVTAVPAALPRLALPVSIVVFTVPAEAPGFEREHRLYRPPRDARA